MPDQGEEVSIEARGAEPAVIRQGKVEVEDVEGASEVGAILPLVSSA